MNLIREVTIDDAEQLINHVISLAKEERDNFPLAPVEFNFTVDEEKDFLLDYIESENSIYLVAEIAETLDGVPFPENKKPRIIGYVECKGGKSLINRHFVTLSISIEKDWRNRGIGRLLMEGAIRWAKSTGIIKRIQLYVFMENEPAIHLYKSFGFQIEGMRQRSGFHNGKFLDDLIMALLL